MGYQIEDTKYFIKQLQIANNIANIAHCNQTDKAGEPYMGHINRVKDNAVDICEDNNYNKTVERWCIITALMHDVLEDSPYTIKDLYEIGFDPYVVDACALMNHVKGVKYYEYIINLSKNKVATCVKLADLMDNLNCFRLKSFTLKDAKRIKKYILAKEFLMGNMSEEEYIEQSKESEL